MGHLKKKLFLTRKDQNNQSKKIFREDCSKTNSLETRGECYQSSNGVTCARPLKILIKAERVKEVLLMHVWLSRLKPF
jgi:hypothetical protein